MPLADLNVEPDNNDPVAPVETYSVVSNEVVWKSREFTDYFVAEIYTVSFRDMGNSRLELEFNGPRDFDYGEACLRDVVVLRSQRVGTGHCRAVGGAWSIPSPAARLQ